MIISEELRERKRQLCIERNTTHGLSKTPEYKAWKEVKKRCYNPNNKRYHHYGARGIVMCDEWKNDPVAFCEYIGPKPKDGQRWSLGRIDNNGNYEPTNCRWATKTEQVLNRRNTIYLTIGGDTKPVTAWAEDFNLPVKTVRRRLYLGWTAEDAVKPLFYKKAA